EASRPPAVGMRQQIPNLLTLGRLLLATVFFALLAVFDFEDSSDALLVVAVTVFVVAALTDAVDGYLARRWNAITVFGRVMDPFADKILILGAFVMLAGANFARWTVHGDPDMASGVETWMVVIILARELLITSLRGMVESRGVSFAAVGAGKIKMVAQSVAVPMILVCVALQTGSAPGFARRAHLGASVVAWATTIVTAWSAIPYLLRGWRAIASSAD
ncbi:MAG: CDP-alcohol phosphatidyltransferase family protein, partial [Phycisphaerales bacterium]